jgi:photosynthetic reaction center M subunit
MATILNRPNDPIEPIEEFDHSEHDEAEPLGLRLGIPTRINLLHKMRVDTQIGTVWLGTWGVLSVLFFLAGSLVVFLASVDQAGGSLYIVVKYFANMNLAPPNGLGMARSLREGGYWQITLLFWSASTVTWAARAWDRLMRYKWRPWLFFAYVSSIFLVACIYIVHPILVGSWADAPALGLNSDLQWAQNFSVLWGDLYYNPFHQLAIFFLFGSTMLWGMHGATILATGSEGSHHEDAEIKNMTSGSQKAMLFWRWTMGFNAFPKSIHDWLWWYSVGTVLASGIGIVATGTMTNNWYAWAVDHGTVAQYGPMTRSAINQRPQAMPPMGAPAGYMPAPDK